MTRASTASTPFRVLVVNPTLGQRLNSLAGTLASIQSQAGVAVDILLVAKHAGPELQTLAQRCGASVIADPGNISAAINAGFAQATPEHTYAAWIGDDDLLRPGALAAASALLQANPQASVCYGTCDYVDAQGALLFTKRPLPGAPFLLQMVPGLIKQETCLFRVSALRRAGGLNESLRYTMDLDLLLRLRRLGPFVRSDRVQAAFCWHAGSLTVANRRASLAEAEQVQRQHARGTVRALLALSKYPMRVLIQVLSWKINRGLAR